LGAKDRVFKIKTFPCMGGGGGLSPPSPNKIIIEGLAPLAPDKLRPCMNSIYFTSYRGYDFRGDVQHPVVEKSSPSKKPRDCKYL